MAQCTSFKPVGPLGYATHGPLFVSIESALQSPTATGLKNLPPTEVGPNTGVYSKNGAQEHFYVLCEEGQGQCVLLVEVS